MNLRKLPEPITEAEVHLDMASHVGVDVPFVLYVDAVAMQGNPLYAVRLAAGLRRRGYRVCAICSDREGVRPMRESLVSLGVDVRAIDRGSSTVGAHLRQVYQFASVIREYKSCVFIMLPDYFRFGGRAIVAAVLGSAGAIVRADLLGPVPPITWRQKVSLRLKDHVVQSVIVAAFENKHAFVAQTGRDASKIDVVHIGIDLSRYVPGEGRCRVRSELGFSPGTHVVGMMAELSEERRKGAEHFLDMAAQVAPAFPRATFLIVGPGSQVPILQRIADNLGVRDRTMFVGWRTDVADVLSAIDVFVMPSLYEGGPTVVLEAMAMALPVIATRVGMVPEVIEHNRTGLIVEPGDSQALAHALKTLLSDKQLRARLGVQAREVAARSFDLEHMVDQYIRISTAALGRTLTPRRNRVMRPRRGPTEV